VCCASSFTDTRCCSRSAQLLPSIDNPESPADNFRLPAGSAYNNNRVLAVEVWMVRKQSNRSHYSKTRRNIKVIIRLSLTVCTSTHTHNQPPFVLPCHKEYRALPSNASDHEPKSSHQNSKIRDTERVNPTGLGYHKYSSLPPTHASRSSHAFVGDTFFAGDFFVGDAFLAGDFFVAAALFVAGAAFLSPAPEPLLTLPDLVLLRIWGLSSETALALWKD